MCRQIADFHLHKHLKRFIIVISAYSQNVGSLYFGCHPRFSVSVVLSSSVCLAFSLDVCLWFSLFIYTVVFTVALKIKPLLPIVGGSCHKHCLLSRRQYSCHDKCVVAKNIVCRDKNDKTLSRQILVATSVLLSQQTRVCRDKTRLSSRQNYACRDKTFVATNIILSRQKFCHPDFREFQKTDL